jgi:hypothetical protein
VAADRGRSRRVNIPGVAELLRPAVSVPAATDERPATGREKHDHKITVYLSAGELLDLEHARLALRRLGLVIDRGRLVREAIAVLLADLDTRGRDSVIARRLARENDDLQDGDLQDGDLQDHDRQGHDRKAHEKSNGHTASSGENA